MAFSFVAELQNVSASPRLGLWIEAEGTNRPFTDERSFKKLTDFITNTAKFTDLYCQVYRGGRSWFPSMVADASPYFEAKKGSLDPLRETIDFAHAHNRKIHAWVNVLRLAQDGNVPLLRVVGKEAALTDSEGHSLLFYDEEGKPPNDSRSEGSKLDTPGIWLDPSSPKVRGYILETIRDLITFYPDLDGVHLDMIRYPFSVSAGEGGKKVSYGHSTESVARFLQIYPHHTSAQGEQWNNWRRSQLTLLVAEIHDLLRETAPHMELSVAGLASVERAYQSAFQDWAGWLRGGLVDTVLPMNYTADTKYSREIAQRAIAQRSSGSVLMGLGAWLLIDHPSGLIDQVRGALDSGANGVVLFSYSNLESRSGREVTRKVGTFVLNYGQAIVQAQSE